MAATDERRAVRQRAARRVAALLVLALLVGWAVLTNRSFHEPPRRPADAERSLMEARRLAAEGRYREAMQAIDRAKQSDPGQPAPYLLRAEILRQSAHYREASEEVRAAYRLAPDDPQIGAALLQYMPGVLPPSEAEAVARSILKRQPENAEAHYGLGFAIVLGQNRERYPEALKAFQQAIQFAPGSAVTLIEMGKLYSLMGNQEAAVATLENAARILDGSRQQMQMTRGVFGEWLKQRQSAAFWRAQAYRRMRRTAEMHAASAEAARWSRLEREFRRLQERAFAQPPDIDARARLEELVRTGGMGAKPEKESGQK